MVIAVLAIASFIAVISPATAPLRLRLPVSTTWALVWAPTCADRHFAVCRHALFRRGLAAQRALGRGRAVVFIAVISILSLVVPGTSDS
ncbi:MAG: hypothetical protein ACLU0O_05705 [Collinsella sp.]